MQANKKERTQVNKEIYALENDEQYVAALKRRADEARAQAALEDDAAHAIKLRAEEAEAESSRQRLIQLQEEKAKANLEPAVDDGEVHMEVTRLKKGALHLPPTCTRCYAQVSLHVMQSAWHVRE